MSTSFEEIDHKVTPIGDLVLRRRHMSLLPNLDIYEIKLGEAYLMSSLFHESEVQLSRLALEKLSQSSLTVVIGGLGLGYTAAAALGDDRVESLIVIDYLQPVIDWHKSGIVPLGKVLHEDSRCELRHGDFFKMSSDVKEGFGKAPGEKFDAVLVDIDHTPTNLLSAANARFYSEVGLTELKSHLKTGGVFGLWSDGLPSEDFRNHLAKVFGNAEAHKIAFDNPITGGQSACTVYLASKN